MSDAGPLHAPADGELIRRLDGEPQVVLGESADVRFDAAGTASRLWELRDASRRFSEAVATLETPPLPPLELPRRRPRLRAAAIALLLATSAAAAAPVTRNAAIDVARRAGGWLTGAPVAVPVEITGSATLAVPAPGPSFAVEVARAQAGGVLRVETVAGESVRVSAPAAELLALPARVRVLNATDDRGDVVVGVPAHLRTLRVRVGETDHVVELDGATAEIRVPLGR